MAYTIIALWTHPRSISTAIERFMLQRGDLVVMHEPFSHLYYAHEKRAHAAMMEQDPHAPRTYRDITQAIIQAAESSPVFFKDMAYHCRNHILDDHAFLRRLHSTFLVRDPVQAIPSHHALNPEVTLDEIGYEHEHDVFRAVGELTQRPPVVIDAGDVLEDPAGVLAAYCEAVGIAFDEASLRWEPGARPEWRSWGGWHEDAAQSESIQRRDKQYRVGVDDSPRLSAYLEHHRPYYEAMRRHRITVSASRGSPPHHG